MYGSCVAVFVVVVLRLVWWRCDDMKCGCVCSMHSNGVAMGHGGAVMVCVVVCRDSSMYV